MREVFKCTNPTGVGAKGQGLPGICAGMTAVWCLKMGVGLDLAATKPGFSESFHLEFDYDRFVHTKGPAGLAPFFKSARLEIGDVWKDIGGNTAATIEANGDGKIYFWGYPGHAIGAARQNHLYYVFDPDHGLYEGSCGEFWKHLKGAYAEQIKLADWWLIQVRPDPKQLHLVSPKARGQR